MKQFIFGSPLVGELSLIGVYPLSRKEVMPPVGRSELLQGTEELFPPELTNPVLKTDKLYGAKP